MQEEAILTYHASEMVLAIHSNALYLSEPKARSQAGGHMFMAGKEEIPFNNGAVLNISQIIRAVMSSAAEAESGALFINTKTAVSMQQTLIELGHPQPCTLMQTDNATAHALLTNKSYPNHSGPWTCLSTGYGAATPKDNSIITGDLAHRTWQITSPSITPQHTTSLYSQQSSQQSMIQNTGNSSSHRWPCRQTNHQAATIGPPARKQENLENWAGRKKNKQQKPS